MLPLFDNINYMSTNARNVVLPDHATLDDFTYALSFLRCYTESIGTFNSYRREVERLLQWCAHKETSLTQINRDDIEQFIRFCQHPPKSWIGLKKVARFLVKGGVRTPNPEWKPFVVTLRKSQTHAMRIEGLVPSIVDYKLSQGSLQETFAILSTFFNFLISERYLSSNPLELIRQKSKYFRKQQNSAQLRRLTPIQWQTILDSVDKIEGKTDIWKERTRFILSLLFGLYLRISEVTASERWSPIMSHFTKDSEGNWWFTTVGKGNKERQIAVSEAVLASLTRWRSFLKLNPLPTAADTRPLIPKLRDYGPMTNTRAVRRILQLCFDKAAEILAVSHPDESDGMREVTVHWLRHTAISEDVKSRPLNHVRDDAGHQSITTTNRYVNTLHRERHQSARNKPIQPSKD
jgi:site-specific recombinase XerD